MCLFSNSLWQFSAFCVVMVKSESSEDGGAKEGGREEAIDKPGQRGAEDL
jgi:hypothetical protein